MYIKNILVVDDEKSPREIAFALEARNYEVQPCEDLIMAGYYTSQAYIDDGGKPFDALLLDLSMDASFLPDELWAEARKTFSGWVFYEKILKDSNPTLYKNTIFYTAMGDKLRKKIGDTRYNELLILSKTESNLVQTADNMLRKLGTIN